MNCTQDADKELWCIEEDEDSPLCTPKRSSGVGGQMVVNMGALKPEGGMRKWVATKFHADDPVWWSYILCQSCIIELVGAVWPKSIGLTVESTDISFTFLHTVLTFNQDIHQDIDVGIRNQNKPWIDGSTQRPETCGLPPFVQHVTTSRNLEPILFSKI